MGDELERFLGEWKHQLEVKQKVSTAPSSKCGPKPDNEERLGKRSERDEPAVLLPGVKRQAREPSPLLVLPSVETSNGGAVQLDTGDKSSLKNKTETLVDTLIADLVGTE